ncbi:bifunctional DNA primase/polymerase [Eremococcus coleocola]|uniref:bifunctional DNA primase/polymerase n=1 Tax=Eremococcus coleocola TaxID=88132 RepID=UPI00041F2291|nr:bifunctional DNA primase/polymerase [Eremococcus coleocola]
MNGYDLAIDLLNYGLQIIPLDQHKKPIVAFKDITIDSDFVNRNIEAYSKVSAFGMLTRGVWCIDIDLHGHNGFESLKRIPYYDELVDNAKNTMVQSTPSGGKHIIFKKHNGIEYGQKIGYLDGVDIKAHDNNYFVFGGSVTKKGKYEITNLHEPVYYEGDFEKHIFSVRGNFEEQKINKYSVAATLTNYDFSHLTGSGGLGKEAYERIIKGESIERNNDLYLASSYAKQCSKPIEPLKKLIGNVKNGDVFTESEWIATVNSAN